MKVGIIVGSGTGRELADSFKLVLEKIAKVLKLKIEIIECKYEFSSYHKLKKLLYKDIEIVVQKELNLLDVFYKRFYSKGGRIIFKTAINAETLYQFRYKHKAVKIIPIIKDNKRILMIRDETQGYYSNEYYKIEKNKIEFSGFFKLDNFKLILNMASIEAKKNLKLPFETWIVYKHHLFANIIEKWISDILPNAYIYQPNNATDLIFQCLKLNKKCNILLIAGNEVGDILHEMLIFSQQIGNRYTLFSRNIYLDDELKHLTEFQTLHGSADDIANKNIVNPTAMLKIIGYILENEFGIKNFQLFMNNAINYAYEKIGRKFNTKELISDINWFIENKLESTINKF